MEPVPAPRPSPMRRFITANRRACLAIQSRLPRGLVGIFDDFAAIVAQAVRELEDGRSHVVVDAGGGKTCPFARHRTPGKGVRIVAVDLSEEELAFNQDVDEKRVADLSVDLPFEDSEVDLLVSRWLVEHVSDTDAFLSHCHRVLKPGGRMIHLFASKNAPFALLNRMLPERVSQRILYFFIPEARGIAGFHACYDRCSFSEFSASLRRHGFEVEDARFSYYQSQYFSFFLPLYLVSLAYDVALRTLRFRPGCSYMLVVARKT